MDMVKPKATTIAIGARDSAPSPPPKAIGSRARTVARVVIRMGRSLRSGFQDGLVALVTTLAKGVDIINQDDGVVQDNSNQHYGSDRCTLK